VSFEVAMHLYGYFGKIVEESGIYKQLENIMNDNDQTRPAMDMNMMNVNSWEFMTNVYHNNHKEINDNLDFEAYL
jgi:uncharacterized protein YfbU (UPF0304 family)